MTTEEISTENAEVTPTEGQTVETETPSLEAQGTSTEGDVEAPKYEPNFKFKVHDEEKEFDPLFQGLVTDEDTEKKIREFHEKAFGLDVQKPKYERLKTEHEELNKKYTSLDKSLAGLSEMVREGDFASFFEALQIPKEAIFQFTKKELERLEADPATRRQMDDYDRIMRENRTLRKQNEDFFTRYNDTTVQAKAVELQNALAAPEVQSIAEFVDAKRGANAFVNAVIERGIYVEKTTGEAPPIDQVVMEVAGHFKPFYAPESAQVAEPKATAQPKPTMPNITGTSTSPIKGGPKNFDDLRKIAQNL